MANVLIVRPGDVVIIPVEHNAIHEEDAKRIIEKLCTKLSGVTLMLSAAVREVTILRNEANQIKYDAAHPN